MAALLEGVRGREGSGAFDNHLLAAAVAALVSSRAAAADAVSYFITAFLPYADVRFYTLRSLAKVAGRGAAAEASAAQNSDEQQEADQHERAASGSQASTSAAKVRMVIYLKSWRVKRQHPMEHLSRCMQVSGPDLARAVYDVLSNIPGEWCQEGAEGTQPLPWCGANAAAPSGAAESAQTRRKRKRLGAEEGGREAGAKAAKWASGGLQRRAWSTSWLALLRMPLPQDIMKKARRCS